MRTHTVTVQWMTWSRGNYRRHTHTYRDIRAASCTEAGNIALALMDGGICPSVSCVWYDWPQKPG